MDEAVVPMHRADSTQEEGLALDAEDSEDEMSEGDSDLSDECCESGSESLSGWGSLPDVCLQHVFRFLLDHDRRSAALVCHHWHNVMRSPSLWRYHFFHFSGQLSKFRQSEYSCAMGYAQNLGVYLERLEVRVCPPRRPLAAQRLEQTISGLLAELIRVRAPLRSLSLVKLELDRTAWTSGLRKSLIKCLIHLLHRGASKLTSVCLNGMRNCLHQGLELLSALSHSQMRVYSHCYISSLSLEGFFSGAVPVHLNSSLPCILHHMQGLTNLSLSYSYLSDELLMALQDRQQRWRQSHSADGRPLQTFSLYCTLNEPHSQLVCGDSWAALSSSCLDLKVKLKVDQVINTDRLARLLLPEIPLKEYSMTAFYSPEEEWSATPLLHNMLPQYRHSLQNLTLDLSNCSESLDEELLELVSVCECLKQLRVWAFLETWTVGRLLHIRLTQRVLLNKIRVRIYSVSENGEQEDQLEDILSSYLHLPPELDFSAIVYTFV
ncbi:F-box only protein 39 [Mastacembelus armatus]|uniref:F-box only protein 39 n=1 Tax=Mastacembelus armatus TaxID=205130 RepID=UPI000E45A399|nr:F-box only protein 39 [Mastacembelus armatus]